MKIVSILFLVVAAALLPLDVAVGQDAAAPFRRSSPSPTPVASQPEPAPQEVPQSAQTPAEAPSAPAPKSPNPGRATEPAAAPPKAQAGVRNEPPVRAVEPRRGALKPEPVRAAESRKPLIKRMPARTKEGPRAFRPTFDVSESSWATAATIRSLENRWQAAIKNHDVTALDKLLSDNLVATSSTGREGSKATILRALRRDKNVYKSVKARGMSVRNIGPGTSVVTGVTTETGTTKDGKPFKSSRRFTDTWKQSKAGWRCVESKVTEVPKK